MADSESPTYTDKVKRDSFGFTVRPHHLERYREYGHIYKEEEEERVDKWKNFLEQCAGFAQSSAGDHCETSTAKAIEEKIESAPDSSGQGNDSSAARCTTNSQTQGEDKREIPLSKEEKRHRIKTYDPIRLSLAPIENMMSARIKETSIMKKQRESSPQKHLPLIAEENFERSASMEDIEGELSNDEMVGVISEETETAYESSNDNKMSDDCCLKNEASDLPCQEAEINDHLSHEDVNSHTSTYKESLTDVVEVDDQSAADGFGSSGPHFPWKELESLVHGGVPKCLRGEVWQAFVGVSTRRVETYYYDLLSSEMDVEDRSGHASSEGSIGVNNGVPEKLKKQIEKDLPRTFPGHPALDEEGRNSLRRILTAYAHHNPSVGYCQAMNFFAGLLLLLMPEENAFWTLVGLIDDYFEGYYTQEMIESQVDQLVFEDLMRERFPKLVNHLDYLGVEVAWISGPWFLSIFANILPWESVLRVWDVILFEGNRVMLFRTALALMELYGPAIVTTKDAGDAVTLMQSLAGSTFDSSQLVLTACMGFLAITEAKLEELRNKHRPSVLGILEERARGSQVFKESKGLATKLYSFKNGPQSLAKETNTAQGNKYLAKSSADNIGDVNIDPEAEVGLDLKEQVVWLKVELCRLLEEKRQATLRAEELETALIEMVKQDNRRQLSARVEHLEQEVLLLRQVLADKQEQEQAMLQVLMRIEQEQRVTEDARIAAEQDAAVQRYTVQVLQEKYEKAMSSLAEKEKRVKVAESMLEATLQYESGQSKALSSPRLLQPESPKVPMPRKTGLLSFGLGWRDRNKGNANNVAEPAESQSDSGPQSSKPTGNVE